jgi:alpha-L-fucosidase
MLIVCLALAGYATAFQTQVDLTPFLNNKAAAKEGTTANFDAHNGSYPAEYLPSGSLVDAAISVN